MRSFTAQSYWKAYNNLHPELRKTADAKFELWKGNPFHPSLCFKCVHAAQNIWSARITSGYRALGVRKDEEIIWFWIGNHTEYEKLLR
jgi:hypothetical protein